MNKFLRSLVKAGLYLLEQSDRATADVRDRVKDRVENLADRTKQAIRGQEDHTIRNAVSLAAGIGVGVGVGMLFAPARGDETRSSIAEKFQSVGATVRKRFSSETKRAATRTKGK